jgi:DNA-binding MarR family transcriptional regulator
MQRARFVGSPAVLRICATSRSSGVLPGCCLAQARLPARRCSPKPMRYVRVAERAPLSQQELGAALGLEKSRVTRLVQQLEQQGWVQRERDARDSRLRMLRLTDTGAQLAEDLQIQMSEAHATLFAQLTPHEQLALLEGLTVLRRALQDPEWRSHALGDRHLLRTPCVGELPRLHTPHLEAVMN